MGLEKNIFFRLDRRLYLFVSLGWLLDADISSCGGVLFVTLFAGSFLFTNCMYGVLSLFLLSKSSLLAVSALSLLLMSELFLFAMLATSLLLMLGLSLLTMLESSLFTMSTSSLLSVFAGMVSATGFSSENPLYTPCLYVL